VSGSITLEIPGRPVPKGRPRVAAGGHAYTPRRTRDFEELVAWHARGARRRFGRQPLAVEIELWSQRPLRGDLDNYVKSILDGLERGGLFVNDRQVVSSRAAFVVGAPDEKIVVRLRGQATQDLDHDGPHGSTPSSVRTPEGNADVPNSTSSKQTGGGMRIDVRNALLDAAKAELEHNGNYVALVSAALVEKGETPVGTLSLAPWEDEPGMVEIVVTEVSAPSSVRTPEGNADVPNSTPASEPEGSDG